MKSTLPWKIVGAALIIFIILLITTRFFIIDYSIVPQNGMYPNMPAGSRVLGWRKPYQLPQDVRRGDIVFFMRSENQVPFKFVWRVIGLPGDKISVKNDVVMINGEVLRNEFVREDADMRIFLEHNGLSSYEVAYPKKVAAVGPPSVDLTIPANHFFVMGDNRYNARDSRSLGPIAFDTITAKAFY
jgi:signal peptidase I